MRPPPPRRDKPRPSLIPREALADVDARDREVSNQPLLGASAGTGEPPETTGAAPEEPPQEPPQEALEDTPMLGRDPPINREGIMSRVLVPKAQTIAKMASAPNVGVSSGFVVEEPDMFPDWVDFAKPPSDGSLGCNSRFESDSALSDMRISWISPRTSLMNTMGTPRRCPRLS